MRPSPPGCTNGPRDCLAAGPPSPLGPAPTRATLPRCGISITRATPHRAPATKSGRRSGSRVSDVLRPIGHVARRVRPSGPGRRMPGLPAGHGLRGRRTEARPARDFRDPKAEAAPYPRRRPFAVRHRLRSRSPASPRGPLMVELFAPRGLPPGARAGSSRPVPPVAGSGAPHAGPGWTDRACSLSRTGPPGGDFHPFGHRGPAVYTAGRFPVAHLQLQLPRSAERVARRTAEIRERVNPGSSRESPPPRRHRIEHRDWPGREHRPGFAPMSLRRTGRTPLEVSGSTGRHHGGRSVPHRRTFRPLGPAGVAGLNG